jgi:uncharacterized protein
VKRWLMAIMLASGLLLAVATLAFAQSEETSSVENPATTEPIEPEPPQLPTLTIVDSLGNRVPVRVEIADTDAERQTGLMGRTALAEDAGMLFVFDQEQMFSFWMKDTLIPLSVAYIDAEGRIVDIQAMQPLDETLHPSPEPAQYALEVNQGFFEARGVAVGDTVELPGQGEGESGAPAVAPVEMVPDVAFAESA